MLQKIKIMLQKIKIMPQKIKKMLQKIKIMLRKLFLPLQPKKNEGGPKGHSTKSQRPPHSPRPCSPPSLPTSPLPRRNTYLPPTPPWSF